MFYLPSCSSERNLVLQKKISQFSQICILNVRELFRICFFKNFFFHFSLEFERKFFELCRNFPTKSSKMHFACPDQHFDKNNMLTLWNNWRLRATKCSICGTVVKSARFVSRWAIGRMVLKEILLFLIFCGRPANVFWFFRWIISRMVVKTAFLSHAEHIH